MNSPNRLTEGRVLPGFKCSDRFFFHILGSIYGKYLAFWWKAMGFDLIRVGDAQNGVAGKAGSKELIFVVPRCIIQWNLVPYEALILQGIWYDHGFMVNYARSRVDFKCIFKPYVLWLPSRLLPGNFMARLTGDKLIAYHKECKVIIGQLCCFNIGLDVIVIDRDIYLIPRWRHQS